YLHSQLRRQRQMCIRDSPLWLKVEQEATKKAPKKSVPEDNEGNQTTEAEGSFSLYSEQNSFSKAIDLPALTNARNLARTNSYTNKEPSYKLS
ncbi:hypothetical protein KQJ29_33140, partial [Enterococcus sp. S181_ASV_20]|nr:hypothetical protein [Enterococcus sp. S181_ASV_20]